MLRDLAYAAFHCSSLRALAASTSFCETKRELTTPDEIEGMASSSAMGGDDDASLRRGCLDLLIPRSAAFRTWLTTPQHGPVRLSQIPANRRQPGANRSIMSRPGARSSPDPVRYNCLCALLSAERLILCAAAWAKDEPPSPTDSHLELPPTLGGTYGLPDARRSDLSQNSSAGPSGEHRWFPFTRRRPLLPSSEVFGAEPSSIRLERRPTVHVGFSHREDRSPALGEKSFEQVPSRSPDRGLRIALPTTPAPPFTLSHGRTPGWDSPWTARPLESFPHLSAYEQLHNGDSSEEQGSTGLWPRTRKRARAYLLNNTYAPLVRHTLMDCAEAH